MKFSLHIGAEISLENFSLSQLIQMIGKLFVDEGMPGLVKAFLSVIESLLVQSGVTCPHCKSDKAHSHTKQERKLYTSLGLMVFSMRRYRCQACKKTFVPLKSLLDVDQYSRKSREYEKLALQQMTEESFRRSSKQLESTLGFKTPHTTLHGWFMKTPATNMSVRQRVDSIIADGTGYKMKHGPGESNRGEVRVVVGLTKEGEVVPFGAWTEASWKNIGKYIKSENHPSEKIKFNPIANTLITDGEDELVRALKKLAISHQRCLFHMTHELVPLLRYKDGTSKDEALQVSGELNDLLYIELPSMDVDPLKNLQHKLLIELKLKAAQTALDDFIKELHAMGYSKARNFVQNAKAQLFTYITNWIQHGITNPKVTSLVERMMREIKRRIKKIGFGWSKKGAQRMTRLVLLQMSSTKHKWETYWNEKMGIDSKIKLQFLGVTMTP